MLFDTHTHLAQPEFDANRLEVLDRARSVGVTRIVAVGCTADESERCIELAQEHAGVFAAVGIQPNYVAESLPDDWSRIERLVNRPCVVAVGETGLDRHWDFTPFEMQEDYFERHIRLAQKCELPFIVHMRDCDEDIMRVLRAAARKGPLRGIMHSFTGDTDMAAECVALGMHISFAGMVTFKKSQELRDCAAAVPAERLLIETDSPYLSPEPVRGKKPNEPAHLRHTAECLAETLGVAWEELASLTTTNAQVLFAV